MRHSIATLVQLSREGRGPQARALAASAFANEGPDPKGAKELAHQAGKHRDPRLLALAFALWPQAQSSQALALLMSLPPSAAAACAAMSPALGAALREAAQSAQRAPNPPAKPPLAPKGSKTKRVQAATPLVVVRGRMRVKLARKG
jgi:hypothetical protein